MSKYTKDDAAKDTETTPAKVSEAWHGARDDAAAGKELDERNAQKVSDSPDGPGLHEILKDAGLVKKDDEKK